MKIGVISDTHGLLRPEALNALEGVDHILHAGDVGDWAIYEALCAMAPVTAIKGNVDVDGRCGALPETETVELDGKLFYLVHSVQDLEISPQAAGVDVVVSGHSHKALVETRGEVLYVNPGSAGPRRFRLPVTVGMVEIEGGKVRVEIVDLQLDAQAAGSP